MKDFYQELFKNNDNVLSKLTVDRLNELFKENVTPQESMELEGLLRINELSDALRAMKNGKCPGIDGFPSEFLKLFWGKLKYFILRALNRAYEIGEMSICPNQLRKLIPASRIQCPS